jgi:hypothetical protein
MVGFNGGVIGLFLTLRIKAPNISSKWISCLGLGRAAEKVSKIYAGPCPGVAWKVSSVNPGQKALASVELLPFKPPGD